MTVQNNIRQAAEFIGLPIVEAILKAVCSRFEKTKVWSTLLAVCPNSEAVLKAALQAAKDSHAPILFAATLNQVDLDRGYTGWQQKDFVSLVCRVSNEIQFKGTYICSLDHGGPWLKDKQKLGNYSYQQAMAEVKDSLVACIDAGYDLLHIDPTVDIRLGEKEDIDIRDVADRTVELIEHSEQYRRSHGLSAISYEVGTEEVHGGLADLNKFKNFLNYIKNGLTKRMLTDVWPIFVVGKVGTDLHTTDFDPNIALKLFEIVKEYGSVIKGHYTDGVSNPRGYPQSRMGGANVGPELTEVEYETLISLEVNEKEMNCEHSNISHILEQAVESSGRWRKWLQPEEGGKVFSELSSQRRKWLTRTGCRYIWTDSKVLAARKKLYENLSRKGVNGEKIVIGNIAGRIAKYFEAFNLVDAEDFLCREIDGMKDR